MPFIVYKIPYETLRGRVKGKHINPRSGPPGVLTDSEEKDIAFAAITMAEAGQPQPRSFLTKLVQSYLLSRGRANPFKDNLPGPDWVSLTIIKIDILHAFHLVISIYLSRYLSIHLSVYLSNYLAIYLSICLSL